jgi:hypothetical protein
MLNQFRHKCVLFNIYYLGMEEGQVLTLNSNVTKYSDYLKYSAYAGVALIVVILIIVA